MRIGIELRLITLGAAGGVGPHLKYLLRELIARHPGDEYHIFGTIFNRGLVAPSPSVQHHTLPTRTFFEKLDDLARNLRLDVLFRGCVICDTCHFPMNRQVAYIPDLQHETFPEFFTAEQLLGRRMSFGATLDGAGAIGTLSLHSRETILSHRETHCRDVFLMPPALSPDLVDAESTPLCAEEISLLPTRPYFLYPANLWPHKNHRRLLQAFREFLTSAKSPMEMILVGHPDGWDKLREEFPELPVRHLGFVSNPMLARLLRGATALTFLSLFEGFGMPLLEAFGAGTPVVCSNTTSLPEVAGDAALCVDPTDVAAMTQAMLRIAQDDGLRRELTRRGPARVAQYTWAQSADALHDAFQRVACDGYHAVKVPAALRDDSAPLVTIVTPSYNQARFLERTIQSVREQTYPRIEHLVLDGGSRDGSVDILRRYQDRLWWVSEPDGGQTAAINQGMRRAQGDILAYLNSDDVLLPRAVERAVERFLRHSDWDMVYGMADFIDEHDARLHSYPTRDYWFEQLMDDCCVCQPATFWRRRVLDRIGPFDESLNFAMDYDYWLRMAKAGAVIRHVHEPWALSRLHGDCKTVSSRHRVLEEIAVICQRHGGYVSHQYSVALAQCRALAQANSSPLARMRGHLRRPLGWWLRIPWKAVKLVGRPIKRKLWPGATHSEASVAATESPFRGVRPDNWLAPTCKIPIMPRSPGQRFYLGGSAAVDLDVRMRYQGRQIWNGFMQAHVFREIEAPLPDGAAGELEVEFSQYLLDPASNPIAFLLQDTNLFTEADYRAAG